MDCPLPPADGGTAYRALLDASPDGAVAIDAEGRILLVNHTFERMFGRSSHELNGALLEVVIPERLRPMHRADLARLAATGTKHLDWRVDAMGLRADGSEFPLEIAFVEAEFGTTRAFLGYLRHADSLARARAELAIVTGVRESILACVHEGILGTDEKGFITFANPAACRTLGFTSAELVGAYGHDLFHHKYPDGSPYPADQCRLGHALRMGQAYESADEVFWRKDGTPINVEVSSALLLSGASHTGSVLTFRDITRRRQLEGELRQTQRMEAVGRLAGGIAHDFNNLLTVILAHADFLVEALPPEAEDGRDARAIQDAGQRAAALTAQLLAYSRRQLLVPSEVRMSHVVTEVSQLLAPLIGEHLALRLHLMADGDEVVVDRGQLEQVITNVVLNARDAMPSDGGTLTIEVERARAELLTRLDLADGPYVLLRIRDSGSGMDPSTLAHACEPFFTTKATGLGTGLGLATVAGIVTQSAGRLLIESAPGQGTVVSVLLPHRRLASSGAADMRARRTEQETSTTSATILLAEDETHVRSAVRRILVGAGYRVLEARHGRDARRVAAEVAEHIDLLLTDVVMPEENGVMLAAWYTEAYPTGCVVFMSGYTADDRFLDGLASRTTTFVTKPFTADALLAAVRKALHGTVPS